MTVVLLCGPSLAGKSSAAQRIAQATGAAIVSADAVNATRGLPFGGEGLPESVWAETLRLQLEQLRRHIAVARPVVVDDTLCYRWLRDRFRAEAQAAGAHAELLLLAPPEPQLLARHAQLAASKQRPVLALPTLLQHLRAFEWPAPDERAVDISSHALLEAWLARCAAPAHTLLFETARLGARHIDACDIDAMHAVYGDADAMRWVGDGEPLTRAKCAEWVAVTHRNYRLRGYGMSVLFERASGTTVGFCGLVHPGGQADAEIKYALLRSFWGHGLATEAARAMLGYGARSFGLTRVIATVAPANIASHRVLLKAGMERAELRRNDDGSFTQLFEWKPAKESS